LASLKKQHIKRRIYKDRKLAIADVSDYIQSFYNPIRRHERAGGVSPEGVEASARGSRESWELYYFFPPPKEVAQPRAATWAK